MDYLVFLCLSLMDMVFVLNCAVSDSLFVLH